MKNFTTVFVCLLINTCLVAQNTHLEFKRSIVLYNLSTFDRSWATTGGTVAPVYRYTYTQLQVLHPTIAVRWSTKNRNFHEVELTRCSLGSSGFRAQNVDPLTGNLTNAGGNVVVSTDVAVRYEFIRTYFKTKDKKLVPALGLALTPGFKRTDIRYHSGVSFPRIMQTLSVQGHVIPRLTWFFREKFYFDFNVPINILYLSHELRKELDPSLASDQQKIVNFNFEGLPMKLSARVGLGIKL